MRQAKSMNHLKSILMQFLTLLLFSKDYHTYKATTEV